MRDAVAEILTPIALYPRRPRPRGMQHNWLGEPASLGWLANLGHLDPDVDA